MLLETPECDRMLEVRDRSQAIGEFLEWAGEQGYVLCALLARRDYVGDVIKGQQEYSPEVPSTEKLLADFFDVDLAVVEREKQAVLVALREG